MTVTVAHITFDAADAAALAAFWSGVLEHPVDEGATDGFATIGMSGAEPMSPVFMFIQVPEPRTGKNRIHVDLHATDPQAAVERVVALGATKVGEFDEYGTAWTTLADSEGNLFDISGAEE